MLKRKLLVSCIVIFLFSCAKVLAEPITLSGQAIALQISSEPNGLSEKVVSLNGSKIDSLEGRAWLITGGSQNFRPEGKIELISSSKSSAVFVGQNDSFKWQLEYRLDGPSRIIKSLGLSSVKDTDIEEVFLFNMTSAVKAVIAKTSLQDIAVFYYLGDNGLFASLDFPYSKIISEDSLTQVYYPPYMKLRSGQRYQCHSLTLGSAKLQKHSRFRFDDGMVDAMDSYIQQRFAPRFNKPVTLSCSINNRYTQPAGGDVFYTWTDHPELRINHELLEEEVALLPKLGIEYYQVFPGVFDWTPQDPDPDYIRQFVKFAQKHDVKVGDYSGSNGLFCGHYNTYRNSLKKPEWEMVQQNGKHIGSIYCFGEPNFVNYYKDTVVGTCKKYGFKLHCMDFLRIAPCYSENHGHPAGEDSIYQQIKGLTDLMAAINEVSPEMVIWPNSGNWAEFLPKLAWWAPNLYLSDPGVSSPWQGLNETRLLDDSRREQMVSLHYTHFLPYRFFSNFQYFCSRDSIVPDIRNYQYGALSTWAVCPNISLGEIRPWLDELPAKQQQEVIAFYKKWTEFFSHNFDLFTKTYQAGDNPGTGSVEVYGHAKQNHGFIFVVNPQYWNKAIDIPLSEKLGFAGDDICEVKELYPLERLRLTPKGPFIKLGESMRIEVPAQQVLVLEISKAPQKITSPRIYGLPGTLEKTKQGYIIKTSMPQCTTQMCEILFPDNSAAPTAVDADSNIPKQFPRKFPTKLTMLSSNSHSLIFECTFRRTLAPTQLSQWHIKQQGFDEGLTAQLPKGWKDSEKYTLPLFDGAEDIKMPLWPAQFRQASLGPLSNFCGGYIDNAFSEFQPTVINIKTTPQAASLPQAKVNYPNPELPSNKLPAIAEDTAGQWWLSTDFHLPFTYHFGFGPFYSDHMFLALPFVDKNKVTQIKAWINGSPLDVREYRYPRGGSFACCYADLTESAVHEGSNNLVIYFSAK